MHPPKSEDRRRNRRAARRETITALVASAGAAGISSAEIRSRLGLCPRLVGTLVSQYKAAGYLHSAGSPMQRVYFTDAALASARQAELKATEQARATAAAEQARAKQRQREQRRDAARRAAKQREAELLDQIAVLKKQLAQQQPAARALTLQASPSAPTKKPRGRPPNVLAQPLKGALRANDPRPGRHQVVSLPTPIPAPVAIAEEQCRPSGEVIVPPDVKRTVAPACAGRFEVSGPVIGGFATMRPGQYLPEAGFSSYLDARP